MIQVSDLTKTYKKTKKTFSLNSISFAIKSGRITGFIGNNGAGKTTTLKCILGITPFESGKIFIDGKTICQNEREYKEKIGVVFDQGYFYDKFSMASMKSIIAGAYADWSDTDYHAYMDRFELSERQRIDTLSKGMKMKFALAMALSHNADILILDEPSSGLDPKSRNLLCEELIAQKEKGKTIFFSTHITSDIDRIGDDIILIDHGSILKESSKKAFLLESKLQNPTVEDAMLEIIKREGEF